MFFKEFFKENTNLSYSQTIRDKNKETPHEISPLPPFTQCWEGPSSVCSSETQHCDWGGEGGGKFCKKMPKFTYCFTYFCPRLSEDKKHRPRVPFQLPEAFLTAHFSVQALPMLYSHYSGRHYCCQNKFPLCKKSRNCRAERRENRRDWVSRALTPVLVS